MIGWLDDPALPGSIPSGRSPASASGSPGQVYSGRVFKFFGEGLRQAGILIFGSALIIWAFCFILGLQCGLQGAYFNRSIGRPLAGRPLLGLLRPARGAALRLRLHPRRQGRDRDRRRDRGDADLRRDRRARGDGDPAGHLPLRDPPARRLDRAPVPLPGRDRDHLLRQLPLGGQPGRRRLLRRLPTDLLDVPEPARPDLQPDQGDGDVDRDRAGRLLLRLHRLRRPGRRRHRDGASRWSSTSSPSTSSACSAPSSSGAPTPGPRSGASSAAFGEDRRDHAEPMRSRE